LLIFVELKKSGQLGADECTAIAHAAHQKHLNLFKKLTKHLLNPTCIFTSGYKKDKSQKYPFKNTFANKKFSHYPYSLKRIPYEKNLAKVFYLITLFL